MHITGANLNDAVKFGDGSYYYSQYPNNWGWATWKRAWQHYDLELENTGAYLKLIDEKFNYLSEQIFWRSRIMLIKENLIDAWDYQWMFSIWRQGGLCLNSNYNLVTNIGFDLNATHTTGKSLYLTPKTTEVTEIIHPSSTAIIKKAETGFIRGLHGIKRRGYVNYYVQLYFLQRVGNAIHKIKLRLNKA